MTILIILRKLLVCRIGSCTTNEQQAENSRVKKEQCGVETMKVVFVSLITSKVKKFHEFKISSEVCIKPLCFRGMKKELKAS